jgi:hypothetical protein
MYFIIYILVIFKLLVIYQEIKVSNLFYSFVFKEVF